MRTITTDFAPSAKPIGVSIEVIDEWTKLAEAPEYDILETGFASARKIARGVLEVSSPLLLANTTETNATTDVRIVRNDGSTAVIVQGFPIAGEDTLLVPLQGQFLVSGDYVECKTTLASGVFATLSYTEGQSEDDDVS